MENLDTFKLEVNQFEVLDKEIKLISEQIKPLNTNLKELKSKKSELQGNICEFMSVNDIDICNLKSGKLVYKETNSTKPVSHAEVKQSIQFFYNNLPEDFNSMSMNAKADKLISFIYDENREKVSKTSLRKIG